MSCDNELGYNYLNTSFSGTQSTALSGTNGLFEEFFLPQDRGVASTLEQTELKSYFDKNL
jgi:hypothetical protein